jgi:uncharacterized protein YidB (DUF937 family)
MSLFDSLSSALGQKAEGGTAPSLLQGVMEYVNSQPGGLNGLVQQFREKGAGDIVSSWISSGPNQPISPEHVASVLGDGPLGEIAQKAGISPEQASAALAQLMPHVVDKATPDGQEPDQGQKLDFGSLIGSLSGLFGSAPKQE